MAYTVFALKWRPQGFEDIVGQGHIVAALKGAIQKARLANAYLFTGPRGVGKTSTARILAKALNCKDGPTVTPCNKCSSCLEISQARNFDVIEIDGASNTGVDNIRELRESVKFAPTLGRFKVYIIDEVHMLSDSAFNALLKTLEEPPPYVKFIFATTHPDDIIPTILSRCQRLDFRRIPALEIAGQLERIVKKEALEVEKDVLFTIAKSSDGSLRDAESVLDQLASFTKGKVSLKDVVSVLGLVEQEVLFEVSEKISQGQARQALEILNQVIDQGKDTHMFLGNLIEHFRNLMVIKIAKDDTRLIDLPAEACERLTRQAGNFTLEEIFGIFNTLVNAQEMCKRVESARLPLEIALVKLAQKQAAQASPPPAEGAPVKEQARPVIEPEKPKFIPGNEPPHGGGGASAKGVSFDQVKGSWRNLIESLGKVKISAATYLNEGTLADVQNNIITVSFPRDYSLHKESLDRQANREVIEKTLSDFFSSSLRVNFILSKEEAPKEEMKDDSFIKSVLNTFNGRVIKEENGELY